MGVTLDKGQGLDLRFAKEMIAWVYAPISN